LNRICVVTSKAKAYYAIVSMMKKVDIPFTSAVPGGESRDCVLIITSAGEVGQFGGRALALEAMDENPGVFKGQLLSKLDGGRDVMLVGVDPGKRIGLAVFYGETNLEFSTFGSIFRLSLRIGAFVRGVPARMSLIRVGNGNLAGAAKLIESLKLEAPRAVVELVDESGTSIRLARMKRLQGDQGAAARIAFRKGEVVSSGGLRTHAQGF